MSTYNSPEWLQKVLWGYLAQDEADFQIVVADDGSRSETKDLIISLQGQFKHPLKHIWHPDNGFQKTVILNKAIVASSSDYLIFSDGDCVPRSDFISTHLRLRQKGHFLSGGYYKLPLVLSQGLTEDDIRAGRAFRLAWLLERGKKRSFKDLRLAAKDAGLDRFFNAATTTKPSWNGHNASGWKSDIVAVNGFDERMEYGAEDREMGDRLRNSGIKAKQIRYSAICIHLDHERGYVRQEALAVNKQIWNETRETKRTYTEFGIHKA
ncbi:glycosyltransferase family 2 protein [Jiella pelagia]|uniref:Glycosyltransferase family 2 protein n=1 Tax=Jiella pelagia TaxID=2986949 RepID=A0ABY7BVI2_9HYPH|nr:glycosyltransferase family 2 protein [Jiella pelagia]WAP67816.1 glycosyltransferase family 2 protein [Jiella pelagia]